MNGTVFGPRIYKDSSFQLFGENIFTSRKLYKFIVVLKGVDRIRQRFWNSLRSVSPSQTCLFRGLLWCACHSINLQILPRPYGSVQGHVQGEMAESASHSASYAACSRTSLWNSSAKFSYFFPRPFPLRYRIASWCSIVNGLQRQSWALLYPGTWWPWWS